MFSSRVRNQRRRWAGLLTGWSLLVTLGVASVGVAVAPEAVAAAPKATSVSGSKPKVSDTTPRVGQVLRVKSGSWKPAGTTLSYQWYLDSTPISGQTGATYVVRPADLKHRLKVSVTGQASGLTALTKTSSATSKVAAGYFKKATVKVSDTKPVVDKVLTAKVGTWTPSPTRTSYQWYKVSSKGKTSRITGATSASYTVTSSVKGYRLKVKVSAAAAGYHSTSVTSSKTSKVVQYSFATKPRPSITGKATSGSRLSAVAGTWAPNPDRLTYQWNRNGTAIGGATGQSYAITNDDLGKKLTVSVKAVKAGYVTATATSPAVTPTSSVITPSGTGSELHVGTFNLSGSNTDSSASGDHEVWSKRMPKVVSQILGERSDVVGLQEAYWGGTTTQYAQLVDALNDAGGSYAVTDEAKSASAGTRILYNKATVTLLDHGTYTYAAQASGKQARYLVWATFQDLRSNKKFFYADTHLDPYSANNSVNTVKVAEWRELIKEIPKLNSGGLPVVTVGDFNTSKWWSETKETLPAMKAAGFGDVMNQQYQTNPPTGVRAETVVNGWINSFNGYRRDVTKYSYPTRHDKVGNGVDWIFATNSLRVKQWKVVIDFDPGTLQINGVIPSDHNMISAIIAL